ncbi:cell envelope-related function transcriptional attenuator common domain-containing protein [Nocardioides scoriae]|uniref:Cell envelope-related function transcriptional attenuator common domain-containing protein n=1 Tax=Nocardioides scoriae TaxID=642780 RepID=A0A1H1QZ13_9ACTN|nr:LCP family protein [Nocardioides scoriae]SDS28670.1 cell envelope-related function transcriptional attenuator common domain-containing protein [Nocardioides scoriae]
MAPFPTEPAPATSRGPGQRPHFRRALVLMLMTLVLPGSAQLVAGNKRTGRVALRIWAGLFATAAVLFVLGLVFDSFVFWLLSSGPVLNLLRFALMALAIGWAFLLVDAWRLGNPLALRRKQRLAMVGVNGVLCFTVAGSLLFASHVVSVQKDFLSAMFADGTAVGAHDGRFNVLLLGGDSGSDRWGMRPDSISVASIDAETGQTTLLGLPRNMLNFPFPEGSVMHEQFPDGYTCGTECELNSLATWAADHEHLFAGYDDPGVEATKEGVEGITGLKINYYAMVNLQGFQNLVDAVGGVELTVRDRIPIGGIGAPISGYIEPGTRTLDGFQTLWFARSRVAADDYSRMARQKCVMNAMLHQLSPRTVVMNFEKIAKASESLITTDIPQGEVDRFMKLALEARSQPVRTLSFVPPMISTSNPDIDKIHAAVEKALAPPAEKKAAEAPSSGSSTGSSTGTAPTPAPSTTGGSIGNMRDGYGANQAEDLSSAC